MARVTRWLLERTALNWTWALRVRRASPSCQRGCRLPWVQEAVPGMMPPESRATAGAVQSPGGLCFGSSWVPLQPCDLVCLWSRAMVCSQRNTSLSQSPRVGFLSSLLPQSKKSPSRLSPAQGPSQAPSSARKEPLSGQVSARPVFQTAKRPLASETVIFRLCLFCS